MDGRSLKYMPQSRPSRWEGTPSRINETATVWDNAQIPDEIFEGTSARTSFEAVLSVHFVFTAFVLHPTAHS